MLIENVAFYFFAVLLISAATMVVVSRNTVRSVLFLILAFFASAALWILLEAEFLALLLIFVYVGAVMTLFLFVVMMINVDLAHLKERFVRYLPLGLVMVAAMMGIVIFALFPKNFSTMHPVQHDADFSNIKALGSVLYTDYFYSFELAAVLLLIAMISAIALTHRERTQTKKQDVSRQLNVTKAERLRIVKMDPVKNSESGGKQ